MKGTWWTYPGGSGSSCPCINCPAVYEDDEVFELFPAENRTAYIKYTNKYNKEISCWWFQV